MIVPAASAGDLSSQLQDELDALRAFADLLEKEQQVLLKADVDGLIELVDQKNGLIAKLVKLSHARRQSFTAGASESETEDALHRVAPRALPLWREIRKLSTRAQHLNQTNGEMIQARLRYSQQALAVLHNAANSIGLYGANGQPSLPGSGRTLGTG
jgi:flagellar biosynthesis protein FlgN